MKFVLYTAITEVMVGLSTISVMKQPFVLPPCNWLLDTESSGGLRARSNNCTSSSGKGTVAGKLWTGKLDEELGHSLRLHLPSHHLQGNPGLSEYCGISIDCQYSHTSRG